MKLGVRWCNWIPQCKSSPCKKSQTGMAKPRSTKALNITTSWIFSNGLIPRPISIGLLLLIEADNHQQEKRSEILRTYFSSIHQQWWPPSPCSCPSRLTTSVPSRTAKSALGGWWNWSEGIKQEQRRNWYWRRSTEWGKVETLSFSERFYKLVSGNLEDMVEDEETGGGFSVHVSHDFGSIIPNLGISIQGSGAAEYGI